MPVLKRPEENTFIDLPQRRALLAARADVLVVGGGPAGIGAAIGAADAGADVVLVERYGFLGGNATAALVMPFSIFHTQRDRRIRTGQHVLFPGDHGRGDPAIGGVLERLVRNLVKAGGAIPPSLDTGQTVPFDPEIFKLVAMDMLDRAGVNVLLHAFASDILEENATRGVIFETKSGPVLIRSKVLIDCTGDADMAVKAGAPFEMGREEDALVQPMTLLFRLGGFDGSNFENYIRAHPDQWRGVHGLWELMSKAVEFGELTFPREDILFFGTTHDNELTVNSTRVIRVLGTDIWDLTYAEWESRRQMRQITDFLKRHVPGFEKSFILQSGMTIGVRETRRIIGHYCLTTEDILQARKFDDGIAMGTYPIDIHNPEGKGTVFKRLPAGEAYDIPLRCLVPRGTENLLVAGRCISGTHEAHSSYRVMPICMATGQAAGVCAAIAARERNSPGDVPAQKVRSELRRQGAILSVADSMAITSKTLCD